MGMVKIYARLEETRERIALWVEESRKDALIASLKNNAGPRGGIGAPVPGKPCADCVKKSSWWHNLASTIKDVGQLARVSADLLRGKEAPAEIVEARKAVCESCTAKDSEGERLHREVKIEDGHYHTCGKIRSEQVVRDSAADGCGCILEIKRLGVKAQCPLGFWKE